MKEAQHFLFVFVGEFTHLAFSNAIEPLRIANRMSGQTLYHWSFMSQDGKTATASNGVTMLVEYSYADRPACDAVFVLTGNDVTDHVTKPLLALLRKARADGKPMGTFCSGAHIFAKAGFLDNRQAALHWEFHPGFAEDFPQVTLVSGVFVQDGPFMTASGGYAAADLMLDLITKRHGEKLALAVSDQMVYSTVRPGSAGQRLSFQARSGIRCAKLAAAVALMRDRLEDIETVQEIAGHIGLSTRQLERLFGKYLQTTPKKYLMEMRLERARQLLLQTELSVLDIAAACGFASSSHFSRIYRKMFGINPGQQRSCLV